MLPFIIFMHLLCIFHHTRDSGSKKNVLAFWPASIYLMEITFVRFQCSKLYGHGSVASVGILVVEKPIEKTYFKFVKWEWKCGSRYQRSQSIKATPSRRHGITATRQTCRFSDRINTWTHKWSAFIFCRTETHPK